MKSRAFASALWADSWEKVLRGADECVQGVASFNEDDGVRLDLPFGEILKDPGMFAFGGDGLPDSLPWLYGFSQDGYRIALSDAISLGTNRSIPGGPHQTVGAVQALFSKSDFDPCDDVKAVTLELNGLAEWLGESPIKRCVRQGGDNAKSLRVDVDLGDEGGETLFDGDGILVRVYHGVTLSGEPELGVEIGHRCMLEISFSRARSLDDSRSVAFRVADFFSFCFGFSAEVEKMTFGFEGGASADFPAPLVSGQVPDKIYAHRMVFPYREIDEKVDAMLGVWFGESGDLRAPSSLLTSLIARKWFLPADLKFIAAAQMLEALSRVGADLRSMDDAEFETYRKAVMAALNGIEDRRIACMAKERIRLGNGKGQRRLLSELVERHRMAAEYVFGDPDAFVRRHIHLRNGITHREGEPAADGAELVWHLEGVLLFAYCAVAEMLGLSPKTVTGRVKNSGYRSRVVDECRKMYAPKAEIPDVPE